MNNLEAAINQVIEEFDIPFEWCKSINDEIKNLHIPHDNNRKDFSDIPFVTIDGFDAKDFDDAVFCEKNQNNFRLMVAIADVASVVKINSEIDREAFKRGTSIYFPNKVIPMLHENISNDLCSLVPDKKRNVLICEIIFDSNTEISSYDFFESTIKSFRRFTYDEINRNIEIDNTDVNKSIESLKILTSKLLKKRIKRKALEIESSEPIINIDEFGKLIEIKKQKRLFAHQMIEESMIAANICAANFMNKHYGFGVYRIHEEPDFIKLESLAKFFSLKGLLANSMNDPITSINSFVRHSNKSEDMKIFNTLILQSLKRAKYSSKEIGHFGLQLEKYSHFTSPIRRYPDLIVHRMIKDILNKSKKIRLDETFEENLEELSSLERRSEISSRQVIQQMICHELKKFVGERFSTFVVNIAEFGLFCEIENYFISGLIHVSDLGKDRYIYDGQANILKGRRTGKTFRIGQKINVQLISVVPEERKITLIPE